MISTRASAMQQLLCRRGERIGKSGAAGPGPLHSKYSTKLSLRAQALNGDRLKVNDRQGNPSPADDAYHRQLFVRGGGEEMAVCCHEPHRRRLEFPLEGERGG